MERRIKEWVFIAFCSMHMVGFAQVDHSDSICWRGEYKLEWKDFKGAPPEGTEWNAVCGTKIRAVGYWDANYPNYRIYNSFFKMKSWTKDTLSLDLLDHERLHFDISEIFARKIRLAVESLRNKREVKVVVYETAIQNLLKQFDVWTRSYDEDTNHGLRPSKQWDWTIKIQRELNGLKKYATKCTSD